MLLFMYLRLIWVSFCTFEVFFQVFLLFYFFRKNENLLNRWCSWLVCEKDIQVPRNFIAVYATIMFVLSCHMQFMLLNCWSLEIWAPKIPLNQLELKKWKILLIICVAMTTDLYVQPWQVLVMKAWCWFVLQQKYYFIWRSFKYFVMALVLLSKTHFLGQNCPKIRGDA